VQLSGCLICILIYYTREVDGLSCKGEVLTNTDLDRFVKKFERNRPFVYIVKSLRSLSSAHENGEK